MQHLGRADESSWRDRKDRRCHPTKHPDSFAWGGQSARWTWFAQGPTSIRTDRPHHAALAAALKANLRSLCHVTRRQPLA